MPIFMTSNTTLYAYQLAVRIPARPMRSAALTRRALARNVRLITPFVAETAPPLRRQFHAWSTELAKVHSAPPDALDVKSSDGSKLENDRRAPDQRTLQLGKTIRTLHERLPTLLASPLPQEILSPEISLHLFPSTHPHLPTVSGRIPYTGALWTAPVAWGRMPLLGNVELEILSERMVRNGGCHTADECRDEKLIVKWKTCGKTKAKAGSLYRGIGATEQIDRFMRMLGGETEHEEFCGIFVFEFDDKGRILKHTIEHAEEGGNYDRMTKVVSVTDWLLGRAPWKRKDEVVPGLAFCEPEHEDKPRLSRHGHNDGK